jgi:KamA family protein
MTNHMFSAYNYKSFRKSKYWNCLKSDQKTALDVISEVLPFKVNDYVLNELIDWNNLPGDPIFQLTFPQREMLLRHEFDQLYQVKYQGNEGDVKRVVSEIRSRLNLHPADQMTLNVPLYNSKDLPGVQHKYRHTILFFPSAGQSCHSYCTFCFRWAQFIGERDQIFASKDIGQLISYLREKPEVTDIIFTGGDPLIMSSRRIKDILEVLIDDPYINIRNIRLGTKSLAYWPQRFVTDRDADELLRVFEKVVCANKSLSVISHYNHPIELSTGMAREAVRRVIATGAQIRTQAPVVKYINDDAEVWADLWNSATQLGVIPYYMFVERDTGPSEYFRLPLYKAFEIYSSAIRQVSGLSRTVRGPSMSTTNGKVLVDGIRYINSSFGVQI